MRAVVQHGYGPPGRVLRLEDVESPEPAEGEVLVRVVAVSLNSLDWRTVYARPFLVRLVGGLRRPGDTRQVGHDAAGIVAAVGPGRTDLAVGDRVFGSRSGALAEYVAGQNFFAMPAKATFDQAACLPIAGRTALQAVVQHGQGKPGEHVAIVGAGGGVGHFALQIAKAAGARVTAVTSTDKLDLARSLGADEAVDYTRDDFTRGADRYDVIIDCGGTPSVGAMRRVLKPGGRIVLAAAGKRPPGVIGRLAGSAIRQRLGQPVRFFMSGGSHREQLTTLREMVEAGTLMPVIDRVYPFEEFPAAISYAATEQVRGKVVIRVADV